MRGEERTVSEHTPVSAALTSPTALLNADLFAELNSHGASLIWQVDPEGIIRFVGSALERLLGVTKSQQVGTSVLDRVHPADHEKVRQAIAETLAKPSHLPTMEFRVRGTEDRWHALEAVLVTQGHTDGVRVLLNLRDVTERKRREARIQRKVEWFKALTKHSDVVILVFDTDATCMFASGATEEVLGRPQSEMSWAVFVASVHEQDRARVLVQIQRASRKPGVAVSVEYKLRHPGGRVIIAESRFVNGASDPELRGFVIYTRDITERKIQDPVTGLPNRNFLHERLRQIVENRPASGPPFGLLLVEVDDYDALESNFGEAASSEMLAQLAKRLIGAAGKHGTVARIGKAQLAILKDVLHTHAEATELAEMVQLATCSPFEHDGQDMHLTVSIGIVVGDRKRHDTAQAVLRAARTALHSARSSGRSRAAMFETRMAQHLLSRFGLENDLHLAIERGELDVHYQPIVRIKTGEVSGFEALVRWHHPIRGLVSPAVFIPVAEEAGLIVDIGAWVLTRACRQLRAWDQVKGLEGVLTMGVNLSPEQLVDDRLLEMVRANLSTMDISPERMKLELTETALVENPEAVAKVLTELKTLGVQLALDDFGTGYSSLSYLHQFPFDVLKIDRSFVSDVDTSDRRRNLLGAIVNMGRSLGLSVIAEGIETEGELQVLAEMQCDYAQGYLIARPVPALQALEHALARRPTSEPVEPTAAPRLSPDTPQFERPVSRAMVRPRREKGHQPR